MNDQQAGERLESWKKIAAYLKRDVRTVQRWEQANGLPIHRLQRAQRAIPYAYASELDAWWKRQSQSPEAAASLEAAAEPASASRRRKALVGIAAIVVIAAGLTVALKFGGVGAASKSVAVLPFIDLSEGMVNEEFADGLSEEIIERLARSEDLQVSPPAASFRFKYKETPPQEIGRSLGVAYAVDGSVRRSGDRVRIVARLMRADDASMVWSETYDLPWKDILALQDDIAGQVTQAVRENLE